MKFAICLAAALAIASPVAAQAVRSEVTTSNGIVVTVYADEFAGRYEYSAPSINFDSNSFALVMAVNRNGEVGDVMIGGSIFYSGDWRFYNSAILRGGEEVAGVFEDRDVVSCRGSRYSRGCSVREGFRLMPTDEQIAQYAENGVLAIQLRSRSSNAIVVNIPVAHIEAVREISRGS